VALEVHTTDYHTAGEPFRIVTRGAPALPGGSVADRRVRAMGSEAAEQVRRMLCHEPRGHADMYGGFVVEPDDAGADLGVLFWHKDGYSTACGHGTIALGAWAVESGRIPAAPDGVTEVRVDVPSGRVLARVRCEAGRVADVTFRNVAAWVHARDVEVATRRGPVRVDLAWGGAFYACLPAAEAGLRVAPGDHAELIATGREIRDALDAAERAVHPGDPRLSGVYGTIFFEDLEEDAEGPHQRNVTVFADGELDRSPCGSGSSARAAVLAADGRLGPGGRLRHDSIVGTTFLARVVASVTEHGRPAVVTEVQGTAHRTGEHRFVLDPRDPVGPGFVLR
jgi:proline racemase